MTISFEVTNTGKMKADEIAQVYLSPTAADQPIRPIQLQGFARVSLEPGQTKTVKVKLYTEQLGFYSHEQQRQWNILPGTYIIKVGASSTDIRLQEKVTLTGKAVSKPLREYYFSESKVE
jgi:beta-glucosidase